ncbi:MAG TPA: HYR domain-containing protein, partial [Blastocatellia bacterium]|nr:HYR domain-containing protein [Blastocatellia bacterium]
MTRKFVLIVALIGAALIMPPSILLFKAGASIRESRSGDATRGVAHSNYQRAAGADERNRFFAATANSFNRNAPPERFTPASAGRGRTALMSPLGINPLVVNNTGDNPDATPGDGLCSDGMGGCSLRAAIQEANATTGLDAIEFSIDVSGVATIAPSTPLPDITDPVFIDGFSQAGASPNTLPNGNDAVLLIELSGANLGPASGLTVTGGNSTVQGLIINRFAGSGIVLSGGGNNTIQGNFIGTDSAGNADLGNGASGIRIQSLSNSNNVGGSTPDARNVISGNNGDGVLITGTGSDNNFVANNYIGTNAAGAAALGNSANGIAVGFSTNNLVESNIISGNGQNGVSIFGGGTGNEVVNNFIGTDFNGTAALGNGGNGVNVSGTSGNFIGGGGGEGINVIAFNTANGVLVVSGAANAILSNSIFSNGALGIDLNPAGATPNDPCDSDSGANNLQNFPVLTSVNSGSTNTTIQGTLNSAPNAGFLIEFFSNTSCDQSGFGEGRTRIGSTNVSTDASCNAVINANLPTFVPSGSVITATATDSQGNTSEFSKCILVGSGGPVSDDLSITKSDSPDPVVSGSQVTYTILVTNNGTNQASGVTVTDTVPSTSGGYTFASVNSTQGSCVTPPQGGTGTVTCSLGVLNGGATATITLVVNVTAPPGSTIINITSVSSSTPDSNPGNNSATATTAVVSAAACVLTCPADITTGAGVSQCGANVNYPLPTTSGSCFGIICTPQPGSFFPLGTTTVTCSEIAVPGFAPPLAVGPCSFRVTVIDNVAPLITCPANISVTPGQGQRSAVVTYPPPVVTDNCRDSFGTDCNPPSGAAFPVGTTAVTCVATDASGNSSACSFTVSVADTQPPTITCPGNVVVQGASDQCSAVVSFPAPNITGSPAGTGVVCVPPSGATFPVGVTTITCAATTPAGARATCSFSVTVAGPPQARVTLESNKSALDFGPTEPLRKSKKKPPKGCDCSETFMIENTGCGVLGLDLASIMRTGSDVDSGRITDPDDSKFFTVTIINPDGTERPATCETGNSPCIRINPGQKLTFRVVFKPLIPAAFSGKTRGLAASEVVPERITSKITFNQSGGAPLVINMVGRVSTPIRLIDPENP